MNHKTNRRDCGVSSLILAAIAALSEKLIALAIGSSLLLLYDIVGFLSIGGTFNEKNTKKYC